MTDYVFTLTEGSHTHQIWRIHSFGIENLFLSQKYIKLVQFFLILLLWLHLYSQSIDNY